MHLKKKEKDTTVYLSFITFDGGTVPRWEWPDAHDLSVMDGIRHADHIRTHHTAIQNTSAPTNPPADWQWPDADNLPSVLNATTVILGMG